MKPTVSIVTPKYLGVRFDTWTVTAYEEGRYQLVCDCGRVKAIKVCNLKKQVESNYAECACHRKPNYNQLPQGEASFNFLFETYKHKAQKRGFDFHLSRESFREMTRSRCAYCHAEPYQVRKTTSGSPYVYTGIDRIDSSRGYVEGNCVPCCKRCNAAKSDMPLVEWIGHIRRVLAVWEGASNE